MGIVNEAIKRSKKFDRVYCVVDRDTHPHWDQVLSKTQSNQTVVLVPSYPCFEYWLICHFEYTRKGYCATDKKSSGAQMVDALKKHPGMDGYDKGKVSDLYTFLKEKLGTAKTHAKRATVDAVATGDLNPSTEMHILIDKLIELGEPETVS